MLITLAFRNIWRNRRRTFITAASILFAVFFAVVMRSIQEGTWNHMIDSVVRYHIGYGQIHEKGFWDEQSINKAFLLDDSLTQIRTRVEGVEDLIPRIEQFALASASNTTRGVLVLGIDPEREDAMSNISGRIDTGAYLEKGSPDILVGNGLAEKLDISLGDSLVLISQGFRGANAVGIYAVAGIVHIGAPDISNRMVYMTLPEAQYLFAAYDRVTSLVVLPGDPEQLNPVITRLENALDTSAYEVMSYREMMPELIEAKAFDVAGSYVIMTILYLIIGFGIFGTLLMMLKEREYEFGVLKAIGMRSWQLFRIVWLESIFLGILGCLAGAAVAAPVVGWFAANPIKLGGDMEAAYEQLGIEPVMVTTFDAGIFLGQMWIVLAIVTVLSIYPFFRIMRLKPVEAMRA